MHEDDPQIHLSGKLPGAGTPVVKSIGALPTDDAMGRSIASASGAIAAATAGSTRDTTGKERNVLRSNDFSPMGARPLSYCKVIQYGTGI
jgi:hypothetical protein